MTNEEKAAVKRLREQFGFEGLTDEEVLAKSRFVQGGDVKWFDSVDEYKAWKAKQK